MAQNMALGVSNDDQAGGSGQSSTEPVPANQESGRADSDAGSTSQTGSTPEARGNAAEPDAPQSVDTSAEDTGSLDSTSDPDNPDPDLDSDDQDGPLTFTEKFRRGVWIAELWSVWPMFILSVIFAVLSTVYLVARSDMNGFEITVVLMMMGSIWAIFIADFVVRLLAAKNKWQFIKSNSLELLTVLLPFFRPLLIVVYLWKLPVTSKTAQSFFRTRFQLTVAALAVFIVYFVSTLVWLVERTAPHANIKSWGDSIWWGITTLTTVGYGDFVPVTTVGRLLASLLMVGGIFVVGVVSASVVSSFADDLREITKKQTLAAQQKWQRAKELEAHRHYPRWAIAKSERGDRSHLRHFWGFKDPVPAGDDTGAQSGGAEVSPDAGGDDGPTGGTPPQG